VAEIVVLVGKRPLFAVSALCCAVGVFGSGDVRPAGHGLAPCKSVDLESERDHRAQSPRWG
jgi:hypothetical protein